VTDPHLLNREMFYRYRYNDYEIPQVNTGWHLNAAANAPRRTPPKLGADRDSVLGEWLGADATDSLQGMS
jgi:crotonobetainyl-CoA:carnitine CoA-transferase CaiB-like acyl-CoA transferase